MFSVGQLQAETMGRQGLKSIGHSGIAQGTGASFKLKPFDKNITIKNITILFICPSKFLHKHCFYFLLGLNNGPKRNWKQYLCKSLEGQTKSNI